MHVHITHKDGSLEVVRVLLDHGADSHVHDNEGRTPADCANLMLASSSSSSPAHGSSDELRSDRSAWNAIFLLLSSDPIAQSTMKTGSSSLSSSGEPQQLTSTIELPNLGDRVLVPQGRKEGFVRFRGPTHFGSGEWVGLQLDKPEGNNNGSIDGIFYFGCQPRFILSIFIVQFIDMISQTRHLPSCAKCQDLGAHAAAHVSHSCNTTHPRHGQAPHIAAHSVLISTIAFALEPIFSSVRFSSAFPAALLH